MKVFRRMLSVCLCILLQATLLVAVANTSYAASQYDSVRTTDHVVLTNSSTSCGTKDVSSSWLPLALSTLRQSDPNSTYAQSLEDTFTNDSTHYWGVIQQLHGGYVDKYIVFFSVQKSNTLDYFTFGQDQRNNPSLYQDYNLVVPFVWDNFNANSLTSFVMRLEEDCSVAIDVDQGLQIIPGTNENYGQYALAFNNLMQANFPDNATTMENSVFFVNAPFQAPTGYAGPEIPSRFDPKYVAMGDSFSSGEGSFNYISEQNSCHRSPDSYSHYLKEVIPLNSMELIACSGAVTDDIYAASHDNPSVDAQKEHLSDKTEAVTLTIGGNDVGFSTVIESCVDFIDHPGYLCSTNLTHQALIANGMSGLEGAGVPKYTDDGDLIHSYVNTLNSIMTAAPNATIYIGGYPRMFGSSISDYSTDVAAPGGAKCEVGNVLGMGMYVSYTDAQWINDQGDLLNGLIEDAVAEIDSDKVVYVSPSYLNGHGLCDNLYSMINGVVLDGNDPLPESFHPTPAGMDYWGYDFENAMTAP